MRDENGAVDDRGRGDGEVGASTSRFRTAADEGGLEASPLASDAVVDRQRVGIPRLDEGSANLSLIVARPERPAGVETGVVLMSTDVLADLKTLRARGVGVDDGPLPAGEVVFWSGAPLAGVSTQFRLRDPDGNSFLMVAAP